MASAFMIVIGRRPREDAKSAIVARAGSVGEAEFARWIMLPMLDAKFSLNSSPEFPAKIVTTPEMG
jgi:hypothetical protein